MRKKVIGHTSQCSVPAVECTSLLPAYLVKTIVNMEVVLSGKYQGGISPNGFSHEMWYFQCPSKQEQNIKLLFSGVPEECVGKDISALTNFGMASYSIG